MPSWLDWFDGETARTIITAIFAPVVLLWIYVAQGKKAQTTAETQKVVASARHVDTESEVTVGRLLLDFAERMASREVLLEARLQEARREWREEVDALRAEVTRMHTRERTLTQHNRALRQQVVDLGAVPLMEPPDDDAGA